MATSLCDSDLILRYLYLGTDEPFYIRESKPLDIGVGRRVLQPVETLVRATAPDADEDSRKLAAAVTLRQTPIELVEKAWNSGMLVRHDECLFALAYLARTFRQPEEKHKVYEAVPKLIESSEDLFQFVHFYLTLAKQDEKHKGRGFGNGMKVALKKWYDKHSAEELAVLLASDRSRLKWCHKDILVMLHLNLPDNEKMQVIDKAVGGKGRKRPPKPKPEGAAKKSKSDDSESGAEEAKNGADEEPNKEPEDEDTAALQTFNSIKALKAADGAPSVLSKLVGHHYPMHLVPSQLQRSPTIWEAVLEYMPYKDVVTSALVLQDFKLLKDPGSTLAVKYGQKLNSMTAVNDSKISPVFIYQIMRLFEEKQRYLNVVKEAIHTANNLALKNIPANPTTMNQFYLALNESLLNYKCTELRYFVTLDLRSKQVKKRVFANRLMSCQAAYVLLALPMLKKEKHLTLKAFTPQADTLRDVNLTKEMDFFRACDLLQHQVPAKTKVNICQPISEALAKGTRVDVFLTIVDSAIRVNPMRTSPAEALTTYNAKTKSKAVYVMVNLCRHQQDLKHRAKSSNGGVLELVGCTENTPKIIEAYVKGHFK